MLPLLHPIWMLLQNIHTTLVGKQFNRSFSKWDFCSWFHEQLGSRNSVISSEDLRLQAAERRLWCVNIQDFLDICAMPPKAKLLHSKSALSIIQSVN